MREFKFRAWSAPQQLMKYFGFGSVDGNFIYGNYNDDTSIDLEDDGVAVMQFTGLKDKNGKEIYEGDMLRFLIDDQTEDGVVRFSAGGFWTSQLEGHAEELLSEELEELEGLVIGNIHENPGPL